MACAEVDLAKRGCVLYRTVSARQDTADAGMSHSRECCLPLFADGSLCAYLMSGL